MKLPAELPSVEEALKDFVEAKTSLSVVAKKLGVSEESARGKIQRLGLEEVEQRKNLYGSASPEFKGELQLTETDMHTTIEVKAQMTVHYPVSAAEQGYFTTTSETLRQNFTLFVVTSDELQLAMDNAAYRNMYSSTPFMISPNPLQIGIFSGEIREHLRAFGFQRAYVDQAKPLIRNS